MLYIFCQVCYTYFYFLHNSCLTEDSTASADIDYTAAPWYNRCGGDVYADDLIDTARKKQTALPRA